MTESLTPLSILSHSARLYARWAPSLLLLALVVFVPIGLVNSLAVNLELDSLEPGGEIQVLAAVAAVLALGLTGLLGEVFYTGAVAISLTHPDRGRAPSLRQIAGAIDYRRLIAVDVIYAAVVGVGLVLLIAPGVAAFVWFALAAPVVEIEHRGVRAAFARSYRLIRGRFWTVLAVLLPIQLLDDVVTRAVTGLAHSWMGDSVPAEWLTESLVNLVVTPFYAVAVVTLTVGLIVAREGRGPRLHSAPAPA